MTPFVQYQQHAEHRQTGRGGQQHDRMNDRQDNGEVDGVDRHTAFDHGTYRIQGRKHDNRQRDHTLDQHDDAVDAENQRQAAIGGVAGFIGRHRINGLRTFDGVDNGFVGDGRACFVLVHMCTLPGQRYQKTRNIE